MNLMNENFDAFDDYAMKFDFNEEAIRRKYEHSYRVMELGDKIVYSLGLEEDDSFLACMIGLLHDIGRFEQWTKYKTFKDFESVDHSDIAINLLFNDNYIKKFNLEEKDYELVKTAILNHNKHEIDKSIKDEHILLHSKIIRDADKIDILYQLSNPKIIRMDESDDEISDSVINEFKNHKSIRYENIRNDNDRVISSISLIFDLNFDYSKKLIIQKEYLERMYEYLENKKLFKEYFDEAIKYLKGSEK